MQLLPNLFSKRLCLWMEEQNTLVIGDVHVGYDEELNAKGVLIPKVHTDDIFSELEKTLELVSPDKIVLIGDIKHEFGRISEEEWRHTLRLIDFLAEKAELYLIKGNHDTILGPIAQKRNIKVVDHLVFGDTLLLHGHKLPSEDLLQNVETIIMGHEHPSVSLADGVRVEKYKCFLVGEWKQRNLVVVPSINTLVWGTDVLREKLLSPFLTDVSSFRVFIVENQKVLNFGLVKDLL